MVATGVVDGTVASAGGVAVESTMLLEAGVAGLEVASETMVAPEKSQPLTANKHTSNTTGPVWANW
jgi:hypothetical protein